MKFYVTPLKEDWLEVVKGDGPTRRVCCGCARVIRPGETFYLYGNQNQYTGFITECASCHCKRYSWVFDARKFRIGYFAVLAITIALILLAGILALIKLIP